MQQEALLEPFTNKRLRKLEMNVMFLRCFCLS